MVSIEDLSITPGPEAAYLVVAACDADAAQLLGDLRLADDDSFSPAELSQCVDRGAAALRRKLRSSRQREMPFVDDTGVSFGGLRVELSRIEQQLILRLWRSRGRTVARDELAADFGPLLGTELGKALDAHVYRLRKKLIPLPGLRIETVRQRGFRLAINE